MVISIQRFFFFTVGFLFCILGCTRDRAHVLMPDDTAPHTEVHETFDAEASFEENLSPILTTRCALAGCHVADGPHGLDFRTYASFTAGGEHGPAFIPGNAEESKVVEVIISGIMPPAGPPLSAAEIQLFVDWINQQEAHDDIVVHEDDHDDGDMDDHGDVEDMDDDHDDDMDDEHDDDDMNEDHDNDDDDHDDDNGHDDDDN